MRDFDLAMSFSVRMSKRGGRRTNRRCIACCSESETFPTGLPVYVKSASKAKPRRTPMTTVLGTPVTPPSDTSDTVIVGPRSPRPTIITPAPLLAKSSVPPGKPPSPSIGADEQVDNRVEQTLKQLGACAFKDSHHDFNALEYMARNPGGLDMDCLKRCELYLEQERSQLLSDITTLDFMGVNDPAIESMRVSLSCRISFPAKILFSRFVTVACQTYSSYTGPFNKKAGKLQEALAAHNVEKKFHKLPAHIRKMFVEALAVEQSTFLSQFHELKALTPWHSFVAAIDAKTGPGQHFFSGAFRDALVATLRFEGDIAALTKDLESTPVSLPITFDFTSENCTEHVDGKKGVVARALLKTMQAFVKTFHTKAYKKTVPEKHWESYLLFIDYAKSLSELLSFYGRLGIGFPRYLLDRVEMLPSMKSLMIANEGGFGPIAGEQFEEGRGLLSSYGVREEVIFGLPRDWRFAMYLADIVHTVSRYYNKNNFPLHFPVVQTQLSEVADMESSEANSVSTRTRSAVEEAPAAHTSGTDGAVLGDATDTDDATDCRLALDVEPPQKLVTEIAVTESAALQPAAVHVSDDASLEKGSGTIPAVEVPVQESVVPQNARVIGPSSCGAEFRFRTTDETKVALAQSILIKTKRGAQRVLDGSTTAKKVKRIQGETNKSYMYRNYAEVEAKRMAFYNKQPMDQFMDCQDSFHTECPMDWSGSFTPINDRSGAACEKNQLNEDYQPYMANPRHFGANNDVRLQIDGDFLASDRVSPNLLSELAPIPVLCPLPQPVPMQVVVSTPKKDMWQYTGHWFSEDGADDCTLRRKGVFVFPVGPPLETESVQESAIPFTPRANMELLVYLGRYILVLRVLPLSVHRFVLSVIFL